MIYLVEDDESIRELVIYTLKNSGFEAEGFSKPSEFLNSFNANKAQLIILDIMLPEYDGLTLLKKLRNDSKAKKTPIMMLTAKGTEYDKVLGLDLGADDYVTKPFGMMELVSRIKALIRRSKCDASESNVEYKVGKLSVIPSKYSVISNGKDVVLTLKEFELLCLFIKNTGSVFTRDKLLNIIWGYDFNGESRTVDVHIRTLRQKLGDCGEYIETIRGIGYRMGDRL